MIMDRQVQVRPAQQVTSHRLLFTGRLLFLSCPALTRVPSHTPILHVSGELPPLATVGRRVRSAAEDATSRRGAAGPAPQPVHHGSRRARRGTGQGAALAPAPQVEE